MKNEETQAGDHTHMLRARDMSERHSSVERGRRGQRHQMISETVSVGFNKSARDRRGNKDDI